MRTYADRLLPLMLAAAAAPCVTPAKAATVAPYDHIFVVMEENHEYSQIIGNKNAPNLNFYATSYALATGYDSVTHPSAPNYVALVGGSFFGIKDDNAWQTHKLNDPSLTSQLEAAKLTWKGYFQGLPKPGFTGNCYPAACYYASKHNGPIYFDVVNGSKTELKREVPITQLTTDLAGKPPNFRRDRAGPVPRHAWRLRHLHQFNRCAAGGRGRYLRGRPGGPDHRRAILGKREQRHRDRVGRRQHQYRRRRARAGHRDHQHRAAQAGGPYRQQPLWAAGHHSGSVRVGVPAEYVWGTFAAGFVRASLTMKKGSRSFLKKRTKKLFLLSATV